MQLLSSLRLLKHLPPFFLFTCYFNQHVKKIRKCYQSLSSKKESALEMKKSSDSEVKGQGKKRRHGEEILLYKHLIIQIGKYCKHLWQRQVSQLLVYVVN